MTINEFKSLEWHFDSHLALADEHALTCHAEYNGHRFGMCKHAPSMEYRVKHPHARSYTHYMIDGVVYKTNKKLIEAIKEL